jgi:RNA exonuclease 1
MAPITQSEDYLRRLKYLIDPAETLEKQGFIVRPLTNDELLLKRRCSGCNKGISRVQSYF